MKDNKGYRKESLLFTNMSNVLIVLLGSASIIYMIKNASHIHIPYLVAVISAMVIGFISPKVGWMLAIAQSVIVGAGYFLLTDIEAITSARRELEMFSLVGSLALIFIASFLGAFMKRAFNS